MSHTDLFGRTTSYGLGTDGTFTYVWSDRDTGYAVAADSEFRVDGTQIVLPAWAGNEYDSYIITGLAPAKVASASFDIFFPEAVDSDDWVASVMLHLARSDVHASWGYPEVVLGLEQDYDYPSDTDPHILFGPYNGSFEYDVDRHATVSNSVAIERGNWYTAKVVYEITGSGTNWDYRAAYKLWKTADPEPTIFSFAVHSNSDWTNFGNNYGDGNDGNPWLEFYYDGISEAYLDNLTFGDSEAYAKGVLKGDARVVGADTIVCDPFTRSVTHGLGTGPLGVYGFVPSTSPDVYVSTASTEAGSALSVDGSKVVSSGLQRQVYRLPIPAALEGYVSFDFYVPASHGTNGQPLWRLHFDSHGRSRGVGLLINASAGSTSTYNVGLDYAGGTGTTWTPASPGNWYTAKLIYFQTGAATLYVKPQGTGDGAAEVTRTGTFSTNNQGYGDEIVIDSETSTSIFDNFCYWPAPYSLTADAVVAARGFTADAFIRAANPSFTGDAVFRKAHTGSFTADAVLLIRSFTADAYIFRGTRLTHFRDRDHSGLEAASDVVLTQAIGGGRYPVGTLVSEVIADLWARMALTQSNHSFTADAVLKYTRSSIFTGEAYIWKAGTQPPQGQHLRFTGKAVLKKTRTGSFTADAVKV